MYHGEDLAKAHANGPTREAVWGNVNFKGAPIGAPKNFREEFDPASGSSKTAPLCLSNVQDAISAVERDGFSRMELLEQIAVRLTTLTTRVVGPYPSGGPATGSMTDDASKERAPQSSIEGLMRSIQLLHAPLNRMDGPLREIIRALEMLDSATS